MEAKLYVILGSHACRTSILMLEHKGIDCEVVELPSGLHPFLLRMRGFAGNPAPFRKVDQRRHHVLGLADRFGTVPALQIDGRRVKTNREIARALEEIRPDPPLFPADPERRRAVEEAELWGDEVFQMTARRLALMANLHGRDAMVNRGNDGRLGPLLWRQEAMRVAAVRMIALIFAANARAEEELMAALPGHLDRIDAWIEAGVLNGEELNAADFMIAPSLALLTYRRDLRPEIEQRPAIKWLDRLLPEPAARPAAGVAA
jgi:glutathione S-transferase